MCDAMSETILAIIMKLTLSIVGSGEATLLFAGDAMMHQAQIDAAARMAQGRGYDYADCFTPIECLIKDADYAVVNLETPLGNGNFTGYPCFNAPVSYASALKDAGFDLFLTANNHTLDRRDKGLRFTIEALDSLGIPHIGTYVDQEARQKMLPMIVGINGFKVAFLNYTYGTNGITAQSDVVIDYIDKDKISTDVESARRAGAEIVVAAMHWGDEYVLKPVKSQKILADFMVGEGVDIIIGGHPHVVEPYEIKCHPVTGNPVPVVYSLGNFISNMKTRDTRGGALVVVKLQRDSLGRAYAGDVRYELVFTVPTSDAKSNFMLYPIDSVPAQWRAAAGAFRNALNLKP